MPNPGNGERAAGNGWGRSNLDDDLGTALIEGLASMAIVFLLLTVLIQAATAMTARSAADAAVAAAARRASLPGADLAAEARVLRARIVALVPGAREVRAAVTANSRDAVAIAGFAWIPPGPTLRPFRIEVRAEVPRVVPP